MSVFLFSKFSLTERLHLLQISTQGAAMGTLEESHQTPVFLDPLQHARGVDPATTAKKLVRPRTMELPGQRAISFDKFSHGQLSLL